MQPLILTYWALLAGLIAVCMVRWRSFGRSDRWLALLMILTAVQEVVAYFMTLRSNDNLASYHFYSPIELSLTGLYLVDATPSLRRRRLAVPLVAVAIGCGVINTLFLQPLTVFNSYYLLFESATIILLSLWSLYKLMLDESQPVRRVQFWILVLLLYYWSATFMSWGMYNAMPASRPWLLRTVFAAVLNVSNFVFYSGIVWTFIRYKRLIPSGA